MRVAIIGDYPIEATQIQGGVQAAFAYLVKGLAGINDLKVHVLTFRRHNWSGPKQIEQNGITVHLLPPLPRFERLRNYQTYASVLNQKLVQIQPDVVHAQDTTAHGYLVVRSAYPSVVTVHGIRWEDGKYYSSWSRRLRSYYDSIIVEKYIMKHVHHLIAISHYVTDYFANLIRPNLRTYYVPNAIDNCYFNLTRKTDGQVVLFAGRVIPRKRVLDLVQAFTRVVQQMPSAQLRIAGECCSERTYIESVRQEIHRSHLENNVYLLGSLSETEVIREFDNCNLLVLPSSQETTPMVIAQAMAAGKPVIATRVGGVEEMVGIKEERGILVEVNDIDGLARAMLRLFEDPLLQARLGRAGHFFAQENYHLDKVARRTVEVYRNVVAAEGRPIA